MFSTAYVRQLTHSDKSPRHNFTHQTVKCIAVGKDDTSDGLLFYNPHTKKTLSSSDYRLDPSKPAGSEFNYKVTDSLHFHLHDTNAVTFDPPEYDLGAPVLVNEPEMKIKNEKGIITSIPLQPEQPYTVQLLNSG